MASQAQENNTDLRIYKIVVPYLIGILTVVVGVVGFFLVRWMQTVDNRIASLEVIVQEQIRMKVEIEVLQGQIKDLTSKREPTDPASSRNYFLKPNDIVIENKKSRL